ncbi:MAG: enoyl-ACP reductase [Planctomycetes bacterium]|nr:enoyl-ACP reductase [Planctomycetota bacterium]NOG54925.1 enoyl-ACP reductase [Planctomycetota bacterium]
MGVMTGKSGLVIGVANDRSYAWYIAKSLAAQGAKMMFTHLPGDKMARRVQLALDAMELEDKDPWLRPLDATNEDQIAEVFAEAAEAAGGKLDYLVHSIAFADRQFLEIGRFMQTTREAFLQAIEVSAYTLLSMSRAARPHMKGSGSILAMSYYGAEKVVPGYNVMGVAKATLEATCRYLALEMGRDGVRVNVISGGPLRTLSAMGVGGFGQMLDLVAERSPLGRNIEGTEVGDAAVWLLSDLGTGVTGQTIYVDSGYSIMGM